MDIVCVEQDSHEAVAVDDVMFELGLVVAIVAAVVVTDVVVEAEAVIDVVVVEAAVVMDVVVVDA